MKETNSNIRMLSALMLRLLPTQILLAAVGSVNGIVSSFFASRYVGIAAMSAVGLYSPVGMLLQAVATMLMGGSVILCGKYMGQNRQEKLQSVFSLDIVLSALLAVAGLFGQPKAADHGKWLLPDVPSFDAGVYSSALYNTGAFYLYTGSAYAESDRLLMTGDVILNEASHVIMALEDGPGVSKSTGSKATSSGTSAVKERIKKGQRGLNDLVGAKLVIDGSRGPATRKVGIMAVQAGLNRDYRAGLEVDGSYGPATRGAVSRHPGLYGMSGAYIRAIQCLLYVNGYDPKGIDGHYGPGMKAAVGAFQQAKGLSIDYSVGPKTMLRLVS